MIIPGINHKGWEKRMHEKLIILDVIKLNHVIDIFHIRLQEIIMYLICKHSVIINYANVRRLSINDKLTPKQSNEKKSAVGYSKVL